MNIAHSKLLCGFLAIYAVILHLNDLGNDFYVFLCNAVKLLYVLAKLTYCMKF